jgi:hypothetical protein
MSVGGDELRKENSRLKELAAETILEKRLVKKGVRSYDSDEVNR